MKKIILISLLFTISLLANKVATITAMRGDADIKRESAIILASLGAKLEQNDNIITKDNSKLQIIFKDETVISIGQNSNFSISQYLYEDNQAPVAKFNMLRGAMRTITGRIGDIAPQRFSVSTKTATIGIRGTNFSIFVEDDGSSSAFCTFGTISVAIAGATHIVQQGFYIALSTAGEVNIKEFTPEVLKEKKEKHFDTDKQDKDIVAVTEANANKDEEEDTSSVNTAQLDVTTDDNSGMIITDVSESVEDSIKKDSNDFDDSDNTKDDIATSLSETIAGYTMQNVQYNGTYQVTDNGYNLDGGYTPYLVSGNEAVLSVYFDTNVNNTSLVLKNSVSNGYDVKTFQGTTTIADTFLKISGVDGSGTVEGTFSGDTGNIVQGNWQDTSEMATSGTFDVSNTNGMIGSPTER